VNVGEEIQKRSSSVPGPRERSQKKKKKSMREITAVKRGGQRKEKIYELRRQRNQIELRQQRRRVRQAEGNWERAEDER